MTALRVLTYNVLSLRMGADRVAAVIAACEPDVVCVQEAPRFAFWRRRCEGLAARAGLRVVTGGRPAAAMLLLARPDLAVVRHEDVKMPWHPPRHRRGLAIGVFDVGGRNVAVASTHLSLDDDERVEQAGFAVLTLRRLGLPVVVGGDVNEDPGGPAWAVLAAAYADAYVTAPAGDGLTSTAAMPRRRLDGVFADRAIRVVSCGVPVLPGLETASDHRPVLAVLDV